MFLTQARTSPHIDRRSRRVLPAAISAAVLALVGCSSDNGVQTEDPAATVAMTPTRSAASEQEAILAAYRAFFDAQTGISEAPAAERRAMLEPLATDPALSRVLRGMLAADDAGEVGYGKEVIDPRVTRVDGDEAEIADCQDTSTAGRKNRSTGKVITRGTPEADVEATMQRGADGTWRVATVDYKDDEC